MKVLTLFFLLLSMDFNKTQSFFEFQWGVWSNWPISCSSTCRVGQRCRIRKCQSANGEASEISKCGKAEEGKECQNCVAKGICPIDAQWSEWFPWTECRINNPKGCGKGSRQRVRVCAEPKPKYGGMFCIGNSSDVGECFISCSESSESGGFLKKTISKHFMSLSNNVIIKSQGEPTTLDCFTPAYLSASITRKKLFVLWLFNGVPLKTLRELLLQDMKSLQTKMNKAGAKTSFTLPRGHFQFTGSKLIIDAVSDNDTGVFTCTLNYDYNDFINTFFVLMVPGKVMFANEFDFFTFNSFTDGLEKIENFDSAEIRWYLNGKHMFSGLLASFDKRFYTVYVNMSMQGHWECHLFADFTKSRHWLVNSFDLKITYPRSIWDKFSDDPILNRFCYYFMYGIFIMAVVSVTSFLVVKSRSSDWLNLERKELIIQEEIDNNQRLLMVAKRRAMKKTMDLMVMAGEIDDVTEDDEEDDDDDASETEDD